MDWDWDWDGWMDLRVGGGIEHLTVLINERHGTSGHLGCSAGFNFNLYKEHIDKKANSIGREQVHAQMEKCGRHLIQLNYRNFMTGVKVFFAMTNLSRKK